MHMILLEFGENKSAAPEFMEAHNAWIDKGFADGVFLMTGSLKSGSGIILASGENDVQMAERIALDPFVAHGVVSSRILEFDAKRTAPEFAFLKA